MQCSQCHQGEQRLVRFEQGLGIWACRQCGYETRLIDCHTCERRLIRRLGRNAAGCAVWACVNCQQPKLACPRCEAGWIMDSGKGACCSHCGQAWASMEALGDATVVGP